MAMQLTTQFAYIDALYEALMARPALSDVFVVTGPVDPNNVPRPDVLAIHGTFMGEEFQSLGNVTYREDYTVEGTIIVMRPGVGQAVIKATRDRGQAILGELETVIRTTPALVTNVAWSRLNSLGIQQAYADERLCLIDWTARVVAELRPS